MKTIIIDKGDGWAVSDLLVPDDMAIDLHKEYTSIGYQAMILDIW